MIRGIDRTVIFRNDEDRESFLTRYAVTFNRRYRRHGCLFRNRYKSILCEEDAYLQELVRYIHLNPLRAGLVDDLRELGSYAYSGHSALVGKRKRSWQDRDYVLRYFGQTEREAKTEYVSYVSEGVGEERRAELVGGGLLRSVGGWKRLNESEMVTKESRRPFWYRHRIPVLESEKIKGEWLEYQ